MKYLLFGLGLTFVLTSSVFADPPCHTSELKRCVDIVVDWTHTLPKRSLPTSEDEVKIECEAFNKAVTCALKFRDSCVTPMQKELVGLVFEGAIDFVSDFCKDQSDIRNRYLQHAPCLNKVSQSDDVKELLEYILAVVEHLNKQNENDILMYSCCGYRKIHSAFLNLGIDTCGKEAVEPVLDMINLVFSELPNVLCNKITGIEDKCVALLPAAGTKVSEDANNTGLFKFLQGAMKNWIE